jgi:hypothetical protein
MCEEESPVKALEFLQTQVSSVVDHGNAKETEIFRSLLTHLLTPSLLPLSAPAEGRSGRSSTPTSSSSNTSSGLEHEDSREISPRPKKRSRAERKNSGEWTNEIPVEGNSFDISGGVQMLRDLVDPIEAIIRDGGGTEGVTEPAPSLSSLTGARYSQRTEVFEGILSFITDGEKQPSESLLDLIERDRCRSELV